MKDKPSILHVCKVYLPEKGGVQIVVERICKGLATKFNFSILSTDRRSASTDLGYAQLHTARSFGNIFSLPIAPAVLAKLWSDLRKHSLVVVHYPFPLADIAIALYARTPSKIVIYWHSEIVSQKVSSRLIAPFTKIMLNRAHKIVCSSPNLIEHSKLLAAHRQKCEVIPFGVPGSKDRNVSQPSQSDYFISIARHVPYKGIDVLIRAYQKSNSKHRLVIVGDGPLLDDHIRLVQKLELGSKVDFVSDADDEKVENLLSESRALILPSILPSEAFALVQIEAMAVGRPVINTEIKSGVPWVARNSIEALTVKPRSVADLAQAITTFSDGTTIDEMGIAALDRAVSVFGYTNFLNNSEQLYQETVGDTR